MRRHGTGGLVYSTDGGRMCPQCRHAVAACVCKVAATFPTSGDGIARVSRQSKGRGGKVVTLVHGLALDAAALAALGKRLRSACGAGGTVDQGVLELQGDQRERVAAWLQGEGFTVKRVGA